jgi:hypothetical protein
VGPRGVPLVARPVDPKVGRASLSLTLLLGVVPNALAISGLLSGFVHTATHACVVMCLLPLHRHALEASTPVATACRHFGFGGSHPRSLVPSSWFCATSMVSSASGVAGLLHPAADPGVRCVSVPRAPVKPVRWTLSRCAGPTLRRNPRRKPLCVTADLALLAVLSGSPPTLGGFHCWRSCSDSVGGSGTSASRPCSVVGSGVSRGRCQLREIRSFLGFVPPQGSSSSDRGFHAPIVPFIVRLRRGFRCTSSVSHPAGLRGSPR